MSLIQNKLHWLMGHMMEYNNVKIICSGSNLGMGSGNDFGLKNTFTKSVNFRLYRKILKTFLKV